ncbi:hypothetical protein [Nocardia transvalensis]|uniref:hypothetical protein n=1 Tax=Nocardia transvalensis TaxID=37333 RepID=UPI00189590FA|nr:hypothetical protein [Nocardia transvalensis]MBF6328710.1 hypothetical protein [Nocardia transvalensis]
MKANRFLVEELSGNARRQLRDDTRHSEFDLARTTRQVNNPIQRLLDAPTDADEVSAVVVEILCCTKLYECSADPSISDPIQAQRLLERHVNHGAGMCPPYLAATAYFTAGQGEYE